MASITNTCREAVTLPTGHVIKREAVLDTTNAVLRSPDNIRTLNTLIAAKMVSVEYDPEEDEEAIEPAASVIEAPDKKAAPQTPITPTAWAAVPAETQKDA